MHWPMVVFWAVLVVAGAWLLWNTIIGPSIRSNKKED